MIRLPHATGLLICTIESCNDHSTGLLICTIEPCNDQAASRYGTFDLYH